MGIGQTSAKRSLFFRVPAAVIINQGKEMEELTNHRRQSWIKRIESTRSDIAQLNLSFVRICSDHFVSGKSTCFMC